MTSMNDTRRYIALELSTVEGVTGYATMPDTPQAGDAWPTWVQTLPLTGCSNAVTWHVWVVMPDADYATVVDAEDPLVPALIDALAAVGTVVLAEPVQLAGSDPAGNLLPCIRVQVTT